MEKSRIAKFDRERKEASQKHGVLKKKEKKKKIEMKRRNQEGKRSRDAMDSSRINLPISVITNILRPGIECTIQRFGKRWGLYSNFIMKHLMYGRI